MMKKSLRLTPELRLKELLLAINRIKKNRSHTKASKLSISSVALEAGVSSALIHNNYPEIANKIRDELGKSARVQKSQKLQALKVEKEKSRELRAELILAKQKIVDLASINETLIYENKVLNARLDSKNIIPLKF